MKTLLLLKHDFLFCWHECIVTASFFKLLWNIYFLVAMRSSLGVLRWQKLLVEFWTHFAFVNLLQAVAGKLNNHWLTFINWSVRLISSGMQCIDRYLKYSQDRNLREIPKIVGNTLLATIFFLYNIVYNILYKIFSFFCFFIWKVHR